MASKVQQNETAALYAAFLLYDAKKEISAEGLMSVTKAAGIKLQQAQAETLGKLLNKQVIETMIGQLSKIGAAAPAPAAKDTKAAEKPKKEEKKPEPKKVEEPEDDGGDLGFGGLF